MVPESSALPVDVISTSFSAGRIVVVVARFIEVLRGVRCESLIHRLRLDLITDFPVGISQQQNSHFQPLRPDAQVSWLEVQNLAEELLHSSTPRSSRQIFSGLDASVHDIGVERRRSTSYRLTPLLLSQPHRNATSVFDRPWTS